jgi:demethylmenaquinone methyltransferase/2-methoxy-6-polyprenyl-1,4-benzoquinol methylase
VPPSREPAQIAGMFDGIARHYDTLNHLLSAGFDRRWRRRAIARLALTGRERLLDMCTGTADLAMAAVHAGDRQARDVVGIDFSERMLAVGRAKVRAAELADRVRLVRGDASSVPLPDASVGAISMAFGIRNVQDPVRALGELHRVLVPGGRIAVLEFGTPTMPAVRGLYLWYFRTILPRVGRTISKHAHAYSYLPASVVDFPSGEAFAALLREAGFDQVVVERLTFGVVYLYLATRPIATEMSTMRAAQRQSGSV